MIIVNLKVVSICCVSSIGHIHGDKCIVYFYSACTFTQNVKAYNHFVLIETYELKKLTVANVNKILYISQMFCYFLIKLYD